MSTNTAPHVAYTEGHVAAEQGKEMWENPYTTPTSPIDCGNAWSAGWLYGKKLLEERKRDQGANTHE